MSTLLRPDRLRRVVPTAPNDPAIIAGYSTEMLETGIASLQATPNRGAWENKRLEFLLAEQKRRSAPPVKTQTAA
jgi:hypothetical protein